MDQELEVKYPGLTAKSVRNRNVAITLLAVALLACMLLLVWVPQRREVEAALARGETATAKAELDKCDQSRKDLRGEIESWQKKAQLAEDRAKKTEGAITAAKAAPAMPSADKPVVSAKPSGSGAIKLPDTGLVVRVQTIFEDDQTAVSKSEVGAALDACKTKTSLALSICVRAFKVQKFGAGYSIKKGTLVVVEGGMDQTQAKDVAKCFNTNMKPAHDSEKKAIPNGAEPDDPERFVGECL